MIWTALQVAQRGILIESVNRVLPLISGSVMPRVHKKQKGACSTHSRRVQDWGTLHYSLVGSPSGPWRAATTATGDKSVLQALTVTCVWDSYDQQVL